jgi:hypothetical protein
MSDSDNNEFVQRRDHYNGYGIDLRHRQCIGAPGLAAQRSAQAACLYPWHSAVNLPALTAATRAEWSASVWSAYRRANLHNAVSTRSERPM